MRIYFRCFCLGGLGAGPGLHLFVFNFIFLLSIFLGFCGTSGERVIRFGPASPAHPGARVRRAAFAIKKNKKSLETRSTGYKTLSRLLLHPGKCKSLESASATGHHRSCEHGGRSSGQRAHPARRERRTVPEAQKAEEHRATGGPAPYLTSHPSDRQLRMTRTGTAHSCPLMRKHGRKRLETQHDAPRMTIVARHDGRNHMIIYAALSVTHVAAHHAQRCCSLAHNLTLGPTPHPLAKSLNSSPSLVYGLLAHS